MEKKIEPFKIRVTERQAKVVRERMREYGVVDKVSDDYNFSGQRYSGISCFNNSIIAYFDIGGITSPEISFKDFLNMFPEPNPEKRKLIGYKLKPNFENLRYRIAGLLDNTVLKKKNVRADFGVGSIMHNRTKELKVLNLWFDPVYEERKPEKKAFTIGSGTWMCVKGSGKAISGGFSFSTEEVIEGILGLEEEARIQKENIQKLKELLSFMENK